MYFFIGLFIFMALVLGMNFCFLLIGGVPFHKGAEFSPVRVGQRTYTVERFAVGVSTSVFGIGWLASWFYFLISKWSSFMVQFDTLILHVSLQFIASVGLILSGVAIFKQWKRRNGIFLTSMIILFGSIGVAILVYGPRGHGESIFMYLLGMWTLVIGGFLTAGTYLLDRLIHKTNA
ncbi:MAG: hypothetical protein COT73_07645 [Bdellovibrio sp. CG10_big_fil_rev_8_21_14_0_10_47_8]|nr:MAG: hypothetical protein COT73_07645 [Bdellovibrio sp. CG10_big_fil_rev_8_21_14_0_10_47_8]